MKNRRNVMILLLLGVVFFAPGMVAILFYQHQNWLGTAKSNKGQLLNPPVLLSILDKEPKWKLVLWNPNICETACQQELDKLARIRLALGRRLYQVEIELLINMDASELSGSLTEQLRQADIHLLPISAKTRQELTQLPSYPQTFIANPENFLVLSYQMSAQPRDIFHDIKRLLNSKE